MKGMGEMASDGGTDTTQLLHIQDTSSRVWVQFNILISMPQIYNLCRPMT